jgi:hypothetical protein
MPDPGFFRHAKYAYVSQCLWRGLYVVVRIVVNPEASIRVRPIYKRTSLDHLRVLEGLAGIDHRLRAQDAVRARAELHSEAPLRSVRPSPAAPGDCLGTQSNHLSGLTRSTAPSLSHTSGPLTMPPHSRWTRGWQPPPHLLAGLQGLRPEESYQVGSAQGRTLSALRAAGDNPGALETDIR